jgi:MFS superfamily sulfate permease-like transporter
MKFAELIAKLRKENNEKILAFKNDPNADATKVADLAKFDKELEGLLTEYNTLESNCTKYRNAIVEMTLKSGSADVPDDNHGEEKPKSLQELFAEAEAKQAEMEKGGN